MNKFQNRLISETSPYLLQHAHNPVDWYPWGDEALEKAKNEDKPILVSIGYSACHWCHVMERESFENEATADFMNKHFVNIKIDREERPDLDHIYMDAVQALTGSGGWPLNVFLTPGGKPFYGGTYFPPKRAFNRGSWMEVLESLVKLFKERRKEVEDQAEKMVDHMVQSNSFGIGHIPGGENELGRKAADEIALNLLNSADKVWGGFGKAPKFPQTMSIQYLLRYHHFTGHQESLNQALLSLDKMIEGGIYDQLAGGFARYSTDAEWLAPHFEKMLYDNALLISVISEAYQSTKKNRYKEVIAETIDFIKNELTHEKGGFYAALDADSEGVEGKYYVWDYKEVQKLLGDDAHIFSAFYNITPAGNWEHTNILRVLSTEEDFTKDNNISQEELSEILSRGKDILNQERGKRVKPGLDDKIILGWNALMNTACSKAFQATGEETYKDLAIKNMEFIWSNLHSEGATFYHTWKDDQVKYPAFLDDYAFLVEALLSLYQVTADLQWLQKARQVNEHVLQHFSEEHGCYFYYTHRGQQDIILRKKEMYDGATPSGNATMASNLLQLSIYFDIPELKQRSLSMIEGFSKAIISYPTSFGAWACVLQQWIFQPLEIAILGPEYQTALETVLKAYLPHKIIMAAEQETGEYPLLEGKKAEGEIIFYLCQNFSCLRPVYTVAELLYLASPKNG